MSANIKATNTEAIIGVNGGNQLTVSDAGVVTANSFVGAISGNASSATALKYMTIEQAKEILTKNKVTKEEYEQGKKEGRITQY